MVAAAMIGAAVVGGVASSSAGRSQASAARSAANAQTQAADQATALERETYYDQRALLTPSITAGASARAHQMLMQGYSPDEVKRYLASTSAAVNQPAAGSDARTGPFANGFQNGEGQWENYDGGQTIDAQPGEDYSWVDNYDWQTSSPSYGFRFDEGQRALERSKAAGGDYFSGDTAMALQNYGQNAASQEFEADWRRLGDLAGDGTDATGTTVNVAGQFGQSAAANTINAGNARASGYQAVGQANANAAYGWANSINGAIGAWGGYNGWWGKT